MYLKYHHTWGMEEIDKLFQKVGDSIEQISYKNYHEKLPDGTYKVNIGKWVYHYKIEDDTIYVFNATHQQNVHESINMRQLIKEAVAKSINKFLVHEVK
jgi:predicted transcriptional regulator